MTTRAEVVLVRHGETEWSLAGRHTGRTDLPLTDAGRRRARALTRPLARRSFALVLCSPLRRARDTCELAGFATQAVICDELREWDYGEYEGLTIAEIRAIDPSWDLWRDGCPGGEAPAQVAARADRVLELALAASGDTLAFAHGHLLRVLASRWIESEPPAGARLMLDAGAASVLGFEEGIRAIRRWNG